MIPAKGAMHTVLHRQIRPCPRLLDSRLRGKDGCARELRVNELRGYMTRLPCSPGVALQDLGGRLPAVRRARVRKFLNAGAFRDIVGRLLLREGLGFGFCVG